MYVCFPDYWERTDCHKDEHEQIETLRAEYKALDAELISFSDDEPGADGKRDRIDKRQAEIEAEISALEWEIENGCDAGFDEYE